MADVQTDTKLDEIIENFEFLDDWEDRYRYLIELGRGLEPLSEAAHKESNKVRGCVSQVWLETRVAKNDSGRPVLYLKGDSDAHIVRGLVALLLTLYSGQTAPKVLATDAESLFETSRAFDASDATALERRACDGRANQERRTLGSLTAQTRGDFVEVAGRSGSRGRQHGESIEATKEISGQVPRSVRARTSSRLWRWSA